MTALTQLFIGVVACVCTSCGTTEAPVRRDAPSKDASKDPLPPGPSNQTCNPNDCAIFCQNTACGTPVATCLAKCQAVCGDGYFDDRDGSFITCVDHKPTTEGACAAAKRCCNLDYTSQLCSASNPVGPGAPPQSD